MRKCVAACPARAVALVSAHDPLRPSKGERGRRRDLPGVWRLRSGVRSRHAIALRERGQRVITPVNSAHRVVLAAIEGGSSPSWSSTSATSRPGDRGSSGDPQAAAGEQAMASRQMLRYLERLLARSPNRAPASGDLRPRGGSWGDRWGADRKIPHRPTPRARRAASVHCLGGDEGERGDLDVELPAALGPHQVAAAPPSSTRASALCPPRSGRCAAAT